jgi:hypothetical protein
LIFAIVKTGVKRLPGKETLLRAITFNENSVTKIDGLRYFDL